MKVDTLELEIKILPKSVEEVKKIIDNENLTSGEIAKKLFDLKPKQLTAEELREQFEEFYIHQKGTLRKRDLESISTKGSYGFHNTQIMWLAYKQCARANNLIKE